MPAALTPTNMTVAEMVPDNDNPLHNPHFWCLPPVHDSPSRVGPKKFPMYLVTQGRSVGVWHNWTVVKAMVTGYPSGAQRGHHTMEGCVTEWQQHCVLGVHPHPPDPMCASATPVTAGDPGPSLQAELQEPCMPDLTGLSLAAGESVEDTDASSFVSSVTATTWDDAVPMMDWYFALWRGRIVYTDRSKAKQAFLKAEAKGKKPQILSTMDYDEAQAFAEGVYWI